MTSQGVAGTIALETESTATPKESGLDVSIKITNKGDESAYDVTHQLLLPGTSSFLPSAGEIAPGKALEVQHSISPQHRLPGSYSLALLTHYTDAGRYPFSALSPIFYHFGESRPALIVSKLGDRTVSGRGVLKLGLKSLSQKTLDLRCRLYLPKEILCPAPEKEHRLAPGGTAFLTFPVQNLGGLKGSRYAVFALINYEQDGFHHSDMASAFLTISPLGEGFASPWLIGSFGLLLAGLVYLILSRRGRKPLPG
ncbi:MAG: hypothetical protein HY714_00730 [Candidatus Omnitrophica bacterium]|nr:hypothetical protein [Candidatus Omnitrophota bacterium]